MRRRLDKEVQQLLESEPDLLALAETLRDIGAERRSAATKGSVKRRRLRWAVTLTAVMGSLAVVALLILNVEHNSVSLVDNAEAAIADGRLLDVQVIDRQAHSATIDLRSGKASPFALRYHIWFSPRTNAAHTIAEVGSSTASVHVLRASAAAAFSADASLDARTVNSLAAYAAALADRRVSVVSDRKRTLSFNQGGMTIKVDLNEEFLPIRFASNDRMVEISSITLARRIPSRVIQRAAPVGSIIDERPIRRTQAVAVISEARDLGVSFETLPLRSVTAQRIVLVATRREKAAAVRGLAYDYGSLSRRFIQINEAQNARAAFLITGGRTVTGRQVPLSGTIQVTLVALPHHGPAIWLGQLRAGGTYFTIRASARALVLQAARRLSGR